MMLHAIPYQNRTPMYGKNCFVAPTAVIIGDIQIGDNTNIWYHCTLRADVNEIRIGCGVNIQDNTVIHVATHGQGTYISDQVTIGHQVILHACTIGKQCYIGMQSCIMDDVVLEDGCMIAAGSLVTPGKRIPTGELWAGRPAKFMRPLKKEDYELIDWSWQHYCALAKQHPNQLG